MLKEKVIAVLSVLDEMDIYDTNTDDDKIMYVNEYKYWVLTDEEADIEFIKINLIPTMHERGKLASADGIELNMGDYYIYKLD